jgi:hypothetical protein
MRYRRSSESVASRESSSLIAGSQRAEQKDNHENFIRQDLQDEQEEPSAFPEEKPKDSPSKALSLSSSPEPKTENLSFRYHL